MDNVSKSRTAFGKQLGGMILDRRVQLAPLETGVMQFAYRSGDIACEWVDVTDAHANTLRTEIAEMQAIADHLGEEGV